MQRYGAVSHYVIGDKLHVICGLTINFMQTQN